MNTRRTNNSSNGGSIMNRVMRVTVFILAIICLFAGKYAVRTMLRQTGGNHQQAEQFHSEAQKNIDESNLHLQNILEAAKDARTESFPKFEGIDFSASQPR